MTNNLPMLNHSLRKYARVKMLKCVLFYAAYIAFLFAAFLSFINNRHEDAEPLQQWVYYIFGVFVLISGWWLFTMDRFVFERTVSGKIVKYNIKRNYGRSITRNAYFVIKEFTYIYLTLESNTGKRNRIKVQLFDDGYDGYYKEGDTIVRYRGLNYPISINSELNHLHLCPVCGVRTYYNDAKHVDGTLIPDFVDGLIKCSCCDHLLIDVNDLSPILSEDNIVNDL
ncbi:MAG: hypothetical protein IJY39_02620 [Clostridia bacterium]|nr:hypothetical protein [Clostridia bacterium]